MEPASRHGTTARASEREREREREMEAVSAQVDRLADCRPCAVPCHLRLSRRAPCSSRDSGIPRLASATSSRLICNSSRENARVLDVTNLNSDAQVAQGLGLVRVPQLMSELTAGSQRHVVALRHNRQVSAPTHTHTHTHTLSRSIDIAQPTRIPCEQDTVCLRGQVASLPRHSECRSPPRTSEPVRVRA